MSLIFLLGLNLLSSLAAVDSCNRCGLLDLTINATISKHFRVLFHPECAPVLEEGTNSLFLW